MSKLLYTCIITYYLINKLLNNKLRYIKLLTESLRTMCERILKLNIVKYLIIAHFLFNELHDNQIQSAEMKFVRDLKLWTTADRFSKEILVRDELRVHNIRGTIKAINESSEASSPMDGRWA